MACLHPLTMYWTGNYTENGKKKYTFKIPDNAYSLNPVQVPCGQCIECRLARARETAVRVMHEAKCYDSNCFITLTVSDEYLEEVFPGGSLNHRYFQLFMKKLRKKFEGVTEIVHPRTKKKCRPIRVLMCGEYGSQLKRPHFHAIIFNFDFEDKRILKRLGSYNLYTSKTLEKLWKYGFSTIGDVSFDSACYVAKYVTKKITGDLADEHYLNHETGEIMKSEYIKYPQGFGLGRLFYDKYKEQIYTHDFVRTGDKDFKVKPPAYYDKIFDIDNHETLEELKKERVKKAKSLSEKAGDPYIRERILHDRLEFYAKRKI